jgi:hypothetical protein
MGTEVVPRVSPSLLALRLTCHSVKWSIEAVAHHRLFPPFELFTRVDRWLTSQVRWPTLLFATSPQDADDQHYIREIERVAVGCANARLLQLRSVIVCEHAWGDDYNDLALFSGWPLAMMAQVLRNTWTVTVTPGTRRSRPLPARLSAGACAWTTSCTGATFSVATLESA